MGTSGALEHDDAASRAAVEHLLHAARRHLGMEAAFLCEVSGHERLHRATTGGAVGEESYTITEAGRLPWLEGVCRQVLEDDAPWLIRDITTEAEQEQFAVTAAGPFAAYIGAPVRRPDGSALGTLCCLSRSPRPDLGGSDVSMLQALADVLGLHVTQLAEQRAELGGMQRYADELVDTLHEHALHVDAELERATGDGLRRLDRLLSDLLDIDQFAPVKVERVVVNLAGNVAIHIEEAPGGGAALHVVLPSDAGRH